LAKLYVQKRHICPFPSPLNFWPSFSPVLIGWLDYQVNSLPYAPSIPNNTFAGSVSVNRANHPNDTLFFMAFENEAGSLTAAPGERSNEPWLIWLNGG
jgi:hypothetical protein